MDLKSFVRQVPDFPKPGINFFDISTLIGNADAWRVTVERMGVLVSTWEPDYLAAIDARGFLVASPLAINTGCGMLMVRKRGKLPGLVRRTSYGLEYGSDEVEIQADAVKPGQRVVIVDDLLATGGTIMAAGKLLRDLGATVVGAVCVIELGFLDGRRKLDMPFEGLITYDSE